MNDEIAHYFKVFKRIDSGSKFIWNWPAALFNFMWFLYRKMYGYSFLSFVIIYILRVVDSFLELKLKHASNEIVLLYCVLAIGAHLSCFFIIGFLGNYLFYKKVKGSVKEMTIKNIETFFKNNYGENRLFYFIVIPIVWYFVIMPIIIGVMSFNR